MKRLQKYLAEAGLGSRRSCENLILSGKISINGVICNQLGTKIDPNVDIISYQNQILKVHPFYYYAFHKPKNVLCSNDSQEDRPLVIDYFKHLKTRLYTVGRLDFESEGLIFVTNDGAWSNRVIHPRYQVKKKYLVVIDSPLSIKELKIIQNSLEFENTVYSPLEIEGDKFSTKLKIILCEGKKRHIRVMLNHVNKNVLSLKRIQIGLIELGHLLKGEYRKLTKNEIESF